MSFLQIFVEADLKANPKPISSAAFSSAATPLVACAATTEPLLNPAVRYRLQKVTSLDRIGSKVLSPSNQSNSLVKSAAPGPGSASALKTPRLDAGSAEGPRKQVTFGTDSEAGMQFSPAGAMTGSILKKKSKRLQKVTQCTCLTYERQQVPDKACLLLPAA